MKSDADRLREITQREGNLSMSETLRRIIFLRYEAIKNERSSATEIEGIIEQEAQRRFREWLRGQEENPGANRRSIKGNFLRRIFSGEL